MQPGMHPAAEPQYSREYSRECGLGKILAIRAAASVPTLRRLEGRRWRSLWASLSRSS